MTLLWSSGFAFLTSVVFGYDFAVGAPSLPFTLEAVVVARGNCFVFTVVGTGFIYDGDV
jgi:hypothetical protein